MLVFADEVGTSTARLHSVGSLTYTAYSNYKILEWWLLYFINKNVATIIIFSNHKNKWYKAVKANGLLCCTQGLGVQTDRDFKIKLDSFLRFLLICWIIQLCVLLMHRAFIGVAGDVCECGSELQRLESGVSPRSPGVVLRVWSFWEVWVENSPSVLFLEEQMSQKWEPPACLINFWGFSTTALRSKHRKTSLEEDHYGFTKHREHGVKRCKQSERHFFILQL